MKGIYLLIIGLEKEMIKEVGSLGDVMFQRGNYIYIGSAQNSLEARVARHMSSQKKKHWHIDYFLEEAEIKEVLAFELGSDKECELAQMLDNKFTRVWDFGCSDCSCDSHLFFTEKDLGELLDSIFEEIDVEPIKGSELEIQ